MRVLVLTKRQYTGKDLLDDRYGRLYEIPAGLARRGYEVYGLVLSYRRRSEFDRIEDASGVLWSSINALPGAAWTYPIRLGRILSMIRPDVIWACSDSYHAILGATLSRLTGIPVVIDLYDNFESFRATRMPGIRRLLAIACRHAGALTVVSQTLMEYIKSRYGVKAPTIVVGNGVDRERFAPLDQQRARTNLGLPCGARLIGTAGALSANRGIAALFDAFMILAQTDPNLYLVIAGPQDDTPSRYRHPRIVDLGLLAYDRIPDFYSALDLAVVCNLDSSFGRYCYPQKLSEIIATSTPLVAADVGDVARMFQDQPGMLYRPEDAGHLAQQIERQLTEKRTIDNFPLKSWDEWTEVVADVFQEVTRSPRNKY